MIQVSKSIEENVSVSNEPSGINNCPTAEKVNLVAKENLSSLPSCSTSLANRVSNLNIGSDKITMGQGEYVVFQNGESKELSQEIFEQVYEILNQYSPAAIINSRSDEAVKVCENRYELIQSKVKEIDQNLEVVFVPRTLYELLFIRKSIEEEIEYKEICPFAIPRNHPEAYNYQESSDHQKYLKTERALQKCWHSCYFENAGDNKHDGVKDVAYRLNQVIVKTLSPSKEGLTHQEISTHAETQIQFLKDFCEQNTIASIKNPSSDPSPSFSFGRKSNYGSIKSMSIDNNNTAQLIKKALELDCSEIAQRSFFLYRGGDFQKDSISYSAQGKEDIPYSLSYGTSLFAGCVYDGGATAFYHMQGNSNAYAIPVPFNQLNDSIFYIPPTNTIAQLCGQGEVFHGRIKAWQSKDWQIPDFRQKLKGIENFIPFKERNQLENLRSDLSKEDFTALFQKYKEKAIQLKTA